MDRRHFLQGIVAAVAASQSEALVKLATPEETALVKKDAPVILQGEVVDDEFVRYGEVVFVKRRDQYWPLGILNKIRHERLEEDLTPMGAQQRVVVPGLSMTIAEVVVRGYGQIKVTWG